MAKKDISCCHLALVHARAYQQKAAVEFALCMRRRQREALYNCICLYAKQIFYRLNERVLLRRFVEKKRDRMKKYNVNVKFIN